MPVFSTYSCNHRVHLVLPTSKCQNNPCLIHSTLKYQHLRNSRATQTILALLYSLFIKLKTHVSCQRRHAYLARQPVFQALIFVQQINRLLFFERPPSSQCNIYLVFSCLATPRRRTTKRITWQRRGVPLL